MGRAMDAASSDDEPEAVSLAQGKEQFGHQRREEASSRRIAQAKARDLRRGRNKVTPPPGEAATGSAGGGEGVSAGGAAPGEDLGSAKDEGAKRQKKKKEKRLGRSQGLGVEKRLQGAGEKVGAQGRKELREGQEVIGRDAEQQQQQQQQEQVEEDKEDEFLPDEVVRALSEQQKGAQPPRKVSANHMSPKKRGQRDVSESNKKRRQARESQTRIDGAVLLHSQDALGNSSLSKGNMSVLESALHFRKSQIFDRNARSASTLGSSWQK